MSNKFDNVFTTSDEFLVATLIYLGCPIKNKRRFCSELHYMFERTNALIDHVDQYARGKLILDPHKYANYLVSINDDNVPF